MPASYGECGEGVRMERHEEKKSGCPTPWGVAPKGPNSWTPTTAPGGVAPEGPGNWTPTPGGVAPDGTGI